MLLRLLRRFRSLLGGPAHDARENGTVFASGRIAQIMLANQYRQMAAAGMPLPSFGDVGFKAYSQNDEDGILLYIFALIGTTNRFCIELAAGDGIECNSANLILNHGFTGLLFEGDTPSVERGKAFYARQAATAYFQPRFANCWIMRENIDETIQTHLLPGAVPASGEVDLLTVDVDGNDYWILEAIRCVVPRVIAVEFNAVWGAERAVTVPYDKGFRAEMAPIMYCGASLLAFVKLLRGRGYRLVGLERHGFNAFFVRNDIRPDLLPEVDPARCLAGPIVSICQEGLRIDPRLTAAVKARPWVEV